MTETAVEDVGTNALSPEPGVLAGENLQTENPTEVVASEIVENPAEIESVETDPASKDHGNKGKTPWWQSRINEETNQKRQLQEELAQERREKIEARTLLERLQANDKDSTVRAPRDEQDIEALVDARASQKLFNADCDEVAALGAREVPDFNDKLSLLRSIGVVNDDFLKDIFAVDKAGAHKLLAKLADEPERANTMVRMDSRRRIAELTRLTMSEAPKPVVAPVRSGVSKVPPPKPIVEAISDGGGDADLYNDKMDAGTWSKIWDKKFLNKS